MWGLRGVPLNSIPWERRWRTQEGLSLIKFIRGAKGRVKNMTLEEINALRRLKLWVGLICGVKCYCSFFFLSSASRGAYRNRLGVQSELQLRPTPQPQPQQCQIWAASGTYTGSAESLTHWARPGIEPTSSWTPCWILNPLNCNGDSKCCSHLKGSGPQFQLSGWPSSLIS